MRRTSKYEYGPLAVGGWLAVVLCAAVATPGAQAQETVAAEPATEEKDEEENVEELFVTGSRLRRADISTPAPVTVLSRADIENSGRSSIGEVLQNVPAQSNAINLQFNNGGNGATRVNLRGVGAQRTLVLVNGRRFVAGGNGANASVDLNAIPVAIIERVEILRDGASSVYGSDAIAGVVNIITRRNFSGLETTAYTAASQHGGLIYDLSVTAGETTEKANIVFSFSYYNQKELFSDTRDFAATDLNFDWGTHEEITLGSTATPQGTIVDRLQLDGNSAWRNVVANNPSGTYFNDPNVGWRDLNGGGVAGLTGGDLYNYQPENYLITPSERYSVYSTGHYELGRHARTYFEASYTSRRSDQLLASTPLFTILEGITVSGQNLYNPFDRDFIDVRRRILEAGNRRGLQDIDTYRGVLGLDGGLPDGLGTLSDWRWDLSYVYGRTEGTAVNQGRFVRSRVINAIGPSFVDATGTPTCGTPEAPIAGCVPLNLFDGAGTITDEQLGYIQYDGTARGLSEQQVLSFDISGPVVSLLNRDVQLALGYQYRVEEGSFLPDPITASGDTTGNNQEPTGGDYNVSSAYAELRLPIALNTPGVEIVELDGSFRFVDFSSFGSTATWKGGVMWRVLKHLALRGTASTSFRAPAVNELFAGAADGFPNVTDPCSTSQGDRTPNAEINCQNDAIDSLVDNRAQLRTRTGGNADLQPETADTYTAGLVFTPKFGAWSEGLSVTLDYWNIAVDSAIQQTGASVILANCYNSAPGERTNCDRIERDNNNLIVNINDTTTNIGGTRAAGLDFNLRYTLKTQIGRFIGNLDGTWLQHFDQIQADRTTTKGRGVYDLGVYPDWRFNGTIGWGVDSLSTGVNLRYVHSFIECEDNDCENNRDSQRAVQANTTVDLFAAYGLPWDFGYTTLSAGINNVLDQNPPRIYNGFTAASDNANYDYLGRYFYVRLVHSL